VRCPEGIGGERFFQKHGMAGQPSALRAVDAAGDPYLALDDAAGLVACAQLSAIELHAWGAEQARPDHPDRLVFDLDPDEGLPWPEVVAAAHEVRKRLKALKLTSFCRTTGGKGLHVVVPLDPRPDWAAAKPFARAFAEAMVADAPDRYVAVVSKARRRGRILVDWLRNGRGATAIATYSPRARPGATVAMPISWAELTPELDPAAFTLHTVPDVVRARRDPWAAFARTKQALPATSASTKGRR
jgi:bifunctional non-homologous end joining protein LigD